MLKACQTTYPINVDLLEIVVHVAVTETNKPRTIVVGTLRRRPIVAIYKLCIRIAAAVFKSVYF